MDRAHHARADGAGYPLGLSGEAIAPEARIVAVDAYEAIIADRPYRSGMPVADACAELRRCSGSQFDPVVSAFLDTLGTSITSEVTGGLSAVSR